MLRRDALRLVGLGAMSTPRRPDQRQDPPTAAVAPGSQTGVFRGRLVVIKGGGPPASGLFVYDGSGHLIGSVAAANGTGPLGGTVLSVISVYDPASADSLDLIAAALRFVNTGSAPASPPTVYSLQQSAAGASLNVSSGKGTAGATAVTVSLYDSLTGKAAQVVIGQLNNPVAPSTAALLEVQGTVGVTGPVKAIVSSSLETFHALGAPVAGWTTSLAEYKMLADSGLVFILMDLTGPAVPPVDGTTIFVAANGLPAAYRPSSENVKRIAYINQGSGGEMAALQFSTDGSIQVFGVGGTGASTQLTCQTLISTI